MKIRQTRPSLIVALSERQSGVLNVRPIDSVQALPSAVELSFRQKSLMIERVQARQQHRSRRPKIGIYRSIPFEGNASVGEISLRLVRLADQTQCVQTRR